MFLRGVFHTINLRALFGLGLTLALSACQAGIRGSVDDGNALVSNPVIRYEAAEVSNLGASFVTAGVLHPFKVALPTLTTNLTLEVIARANLGTFTVYADASATQPITTVNLTPSVMEKNIWVRGTAANQNLDVIARNIALNINGQTSLPIVSAQQHHMELQVLPSSLSPVAGQVVESDVTIKDQYGNLVTSATTNLRFDFGGCNPPTFLLYTMSPADGGVARIRNLPQYAAAHFCSAGPYILTVSAPSTSLPNLVSPALLVRAGSATTYAITAPSTVETGQNFSLSALAKDAYQNNDVFYSGTAAIEYRSLPSGIWQTTWGNRNFSSGLLSATGLNLSAVGNFEIRVRDISNSAIAATVPTTSAVSSFRVRVTAPANNATLTVGSNTSVGIQTISSTTSQASNFTGTITLRSSDPAVNGLTLNFANQSSGSRNVQFGAVGPQTLYAEAASAPSDNTVNLTIQAGAVANYQLNMLSPAKAYRLENPVVRLYDTFNNLLTGFNGPVAIDCTVGSCTSLQVNAVQGVASFSNFQFTSVGNVSVRVRQGSSLTVVGSPSAVAVGPGVAHHISLRDAAGNPLSSITTSLSQNFDLRFRVEDQGSNPTTDSGTADFRATTSSNVNLANAVSGLAFSNGQGSFLDNHPLQLGSGTARVDATIGTQTFFATATVQIQAGSANNLNFIGFPAGAVAGTNFSLSVEVRDVANNRVTQLNSGTMTLTATPPSGSFSSPVTASISSGLATFNNKNLTLAGPTTLTASYSNLTKNTPLAVAPGALALLNVTAPTTAVAALAPISVTLEAKDGFGNRKTDYTGSYAISENSVNVQTGSFTPANQGLVNTSFTLAEARVHHLIATTGAQNRNFSVTIVPGPIAQFQLAGLPAQIFTSDAYQVITTALDAAGNRALGPIEILSTAPGFSPQSYTLVANDNGSHTFDNLHFPNPQSNASVTVRSSANTSISATLSNRSINLPGTALALTTFAPESGGRYLSIKGFPLNIDLFASPTLPGHSWGQYRCIWTPGDGSPTIQSRFFSHVYNTANAAITVTVTCDEPGGVNAMSGSLPISVFDTPGPARLIYVSSVNGLDVASRNAASPSTAWNSLDYAFSQIETYCGTNIYCPLEIYIEGNHNVTQGLRLRAPLGSFSLSNYPSTTVRPVITLASSSIHFVGSDLTSVDYVRMKNLILRSNGTAAQNYQDGAELLKFSHGGWNHYFENVAFEFSYLGYNSDPVVNLGNTKNNVTFKDVSCRGIGVTCIYTSGYHVVVDGLQANTGDVGFILPTVFLPGIYRSAIRGSSFNTVIDGSQSAFGSSVRIEGGPLSDSANLVGLEISDNTFFGRSGIDISNYSQLPMTGGNPSGSDAGMRTINIIGNLFARNQSPLHGGSAVDSFGIRIETNKLTNLVVQNNDFVALNNDSSNMAYRAVDLKKAYYAQTSPAIYSGVVAIHNSAYMEGRTGVFYSDEADIHPTPIVLGYNSISAPGVNLDGPATTTRHFQQLSGVLQMTASDINSILDGYNLINFPSFQSIYSIFYGGTVVRANITQWTSSANKGFGNANGVDPLYVNPAGFDLKAQTGSPLIDSIPLFAWILAAPIWDDREHVSRPQGTTPDKGAHEKLASGGTGGLPGTGGGPAPNPSTGQDPTLAE